MEQENKKKSWKNITEDLVTTEVDKCINSLEMCTCPVCRSDLITLTLNNLPPRYVNTEKGSLFSKLDSLSHVSQAQITTAVATAAEIIKKHPHH